VKLIGEQFSAVGRRNPAALCAMTAGVPMTYADMALRSMVIRDSLKSAGVSAGPATVGVQMSNHADFPAVFLALAALNKVCVPLNSRMHPDEVARTCVDLGIETVLVRAGEPSSAGERSLLLTDAGAGDSDLDWNEFCDGGGATPDDRVLILLTSGSTGAPKYVPRSHRNLLAGVENVRRALDIDARDRFLAVVPFCHANGFSNCMLLPLISGATLIPVPAFTPEAVVEGCVRHGVTVLIGSPFIYAMMLARGVDRHPFENVRVCLSSGAPLAPEISRRCRDELGLAVRQQYGSSETGTVCIAAQPDTDGSGCVGPPVPGVDVRLDINSHPGEVMVRSEAVMAGYLAGKMSNAENPTSKDRCGGKTSKDDYFRTGDLGRSDEAGVLYLSGRRKRIINVCGIKVDPVEVGDVIREMAGVADVVVSPSVDRRGMETIRAQIVLHEEAELSRVDVVKHCRSRMAEYKVPRAIEFVDQIKSRRN